MYRPTKVRIDTSALQHNLAVLKGWTGSGFFCPMVKANAYGHDEILIAKEAEKAKADAVGVALIEEGLRLRQNGVQLPILVFASFEADAMKIMMEHHLTPVVGRFRDLEALQKVSPREVNVHVKLNTGMQRLGFDKQDLPRLHARLKELSFLKVEGVCTHLTHGEDAASLSGPTAQQITRFKDMSHGLPGLRHLHKSASLAVLKEKAREFGARPGIGMYGLPYEGRATGEGLKPVLTWSTEIVDLHQVEKGENVGYSGQWTAPRRSTIAVLPMGYADGYMRNLGNKGEALFRGQRVPVVGGVCMDYIFIDLTDAQKEGEAKRGEPVVMLGRQGRETIHAQDIADKVGTIAYEIVTSISRRVPREAV
ncbi:MAG: alanine racemase [Bdellovibrionales bacterium]|nr:alanine racemase [Bdellovibrionales bacterium]